MNRLSTLGALLVLSCSAFAMPALAQRAPTIGVVGGATESFPYNYALSSEASPRGGAVFFGYDLGCNQNAPPDCDYALVNVNGATIRVREVGEGREEQATTEAGLTRTYMVSTWRDASRRTTVELWMRQEGCEVHTCELRGGMTIRQSGRETNLRVVGFSE